MDALSDSALSQIIPQEPEANPNAGHTNPNRSTMKTSFAAALTVAFSSLSQALIFNKTAAYAPGQYDKYKCMSTLGSNSLLLLASCRIADTG